MAWVYNLTVDEAHTYFVGTGQWLVHNCPPQPLREHEGEVGTKKELDNIGDRYDDLTPHHVPAGNYMERNSQDPYNYRVAPTFMIDANRHYRTQTFGGGAKNPEYLNMTPRQALARDIMDLRRIYLDDGLYNDYIRGQLMDLTELVKTTYPNTFIK